jgi:hypothetical protein
VRTRHHGNCGMEASQQLRHRESPDSRKTFGVRSIWQAA